MVSAIESALAHTSLFSQCSARELRLIAKLAKTRKVPEGTRLVVEGEVGDNMLVLLSGSATVQRGGRRIATLSAGDVIGELGVLSRAPRNATAITTADSEIAVIGQRAMNRLIADAPG
ncbi:MAG: family transcriptional regulator, cyclic receptor protein, partial [Actinomycetota bacterium]|nr:family transcriptional regulator, cyclic receptor protein [Actinomycetota bacterium]